MYIGGLASGLDTQAIIGQLMQVERIPLQRLEQRRASFQTKDEAWQQVNTKLSALRSAVDGFVGDRSLEAFMSGTSTHPERASVSVTGSPELQSLTFTVDALARAHHIVSADFGSATDTVGAGTFTLTVDGVDHDIVTDASTTLAQLADQIDDLGVGVSASVLKVSDTVSKLSLTADTTGSDSVFTATGDQAGLATFDTVRTGQDAQLTMGGLTVTRSTNVVTDLIDGVTIDLVSEGPEEVTITTSRDLEAATEGIKSFVDALNSAIDTLKSLSRYDSESGKGGPLLGDATARSILTQLQTSVTEIVQGGTFSHSSAIGLEITRDGRFELDETKLQSALSTDFTGVASLLSRSGSTTDARVEYVRSTDETTPGVYDIVITRAARVAAVSGAVYASPDADLTFDVVSGAKAAQVTVSAGASLGEAITQVNNQLRALGIDSITASDDGGAMRLEESRHGSAVSFTVSNSGTLGLDGSFTGEDVEGTIDGVAGTGSGQSLTTSSGDVAGLTLRILATQTEVDGAGGTLALGQVLPSNGIAGNVSAALSPLEGTGGSVARAREHWEAQIGIVDDQIERFDARLDRVQEELIMRFATLETTMSRLQSQQGWLQSQLAGLQQQG
ncbi:MAG: flagellar filament capping protein FliD [Acidimicrobiia bacterium]